MGKGRRAEAVGASSWRCNTAGAAKPRLSSAFWGAVLANIFAELGIEQLVLEGRIRKELLARYLATKPSRRPFPEGALRNLISAEGISLARIACPGYLAV